MLRFSFKWQNLDEGENSSVCVGVIYILWMMSFTSTAKVGVLMGSRETLCLKSTALFHSPWCSSNLFSLQTFWSQDWLLSAGKAAGTWLVPYKQTIIMLSRSRCLEPVLRWKRLRLIWWNANNVLHAITSIWMLDSLIKRGLGEFIAHFVSLVSQVDVFHTNDYGCQSWS